MRRKVGVVERKRAECRVQSVEGSFTPTARQMGNIPIPEVSRQVTRKVPSVESAEIFNRLPILCLTPKEMTNYD